MYQCAFNQNYREIARRIQYLKTINKETIRFTNVYFFQEKPKLMNWPWNFCFFWSFYPQSKTRIIRENGWKMLYEPGVQLLHGYLTSGRTIFITIFGPFYTILDFLGLFGTIWDHLGPFGIIWDHFSNYCYFVWKLA